MYMYKAQGDVHFFIFTSIKKCWCVSFFFLFFLMTESITNSLVLHILRFIIVTDIRITTYKYYARKKNDFLTHKYRYLLLCK